MRAYLEVRYKIEDKLSEEKNAHHVSQLKPGWTIWRIIAPGEQDIFTFYIAIPPTFPDQLPKFYLCEDQFVKFGQLPHVDRYRMVCTRNEEVVVLNDSQPGEAAEELLRAAIEILDAGLRGDLGRDFEEEFLAYWNDQAEVRALLINKPKNIPVTIRGFKFANSLFGTDYIIAESKFQATEWLNRLSAQTALFEETELLCLSLPNVPKSLPATNRNIIALVDGLDTKSRHAFNSFHGNIILASIPRGNDQMFFSWWHIPIPVSGFRPKKGVVPLRIAISKSPAERIVKCSVKRFDRERLIRRVTDLKIIEEEDLRIGIVGCGSVGSGLVMLLAKSGCGKFTLIDPDVLTEENVARHLCGCYEVATTNKKVEAVKTMVERHLPFVSCDIRDKDILEVLITEPQILADCKIVIFATANMGAERRANDFFQLEIPKPVVYLWLEPFGIAGQMVYVSPTQGGCYRCCLGANGDFRFSVAAKGQDLTRREAGCQVTFTPYGAADLEMFCAIACKEILRIIQKLPEKSQLITWIGDKEQFQSAGYKIDDSFAAHESYSLHRRNIVKEEHCEICKRKT